MNDLAVFAMWPKTRRIVGAPNRSEAEHLLVERDRPIEIGDLQSHSTEMSRFRKSVFGGPYPALGIGRRCCAHVNLPTIRMCGKCYASAPSASLLWPGQNVFTAANRRRTMSIPCAMSVSMLG